MDIYLTYRGCIPSKSSNLDAVWDMRRSFHRQLAKLWGKEPFTVLKEWENSDFAGGAPNFLRKIESQLFVPFYGKAVGIATQIDINLLTGISNQESVLKSGDLDNRVKRIIDALRAPAQKSELIDSLEPNSRWYCVMDDDDAVRRVTASLAPYLDSIEPRESFVFIKIATSPSYVSLDNLSMLL